MSLVINIRGANGSGKTTLAKSLTFRTSVEEVLVPRHLGMKRDIVATVTRPSDGPSIGVIGTYHNNCGGCDGYTWPGSHDQIEKAIEAAAELYDIVVFEGVTITSSFGRYEQLAKRIYDRGGPKTLWILMELPLEELVRRVQNRTPRERDEEAMEKLRYNIRGKIRTLELIKPKLISSPVVWGGALSWEWFTDTDKAKTRLHRLAMGLEALA